MQTRQYLLTFRTPTTRTEASHLTTVEVAAQDVRGAEMQARDAFRGIGTLLYIKRRDLLAEAFNG